MVCTSLVSDCHFSGPAERLRQKLIFFRGIRVWYPDSLSGLSDGLKNALKDPNKINDNLHLFGLGLAS